MMGTKDRAFAALPPMTLEDLVPSDHCSRHLERSLDLGFVRDLVRDAYAESGTYRRTADFRVSTTDPDATPMLQGDGHTHLGYQDHDVVDGGRGGSFSPP